MNHNFDALQQGKSANICIGRIDDTQPFFANDAHRTVVVPWHHGKPSFVSPVSFLLGFVSESGALLSSRAGDFNLNAGMFFGGAPDIEVSGGGGFMVGGTGEPPLFMIGGPIEETGRLRYIDGCRDSLLVPPVRRGAACLNALYFPPFTDQTMHTHPSARVGYVVRGGGWCKTDASNRLPLRSGDIFFLPAGALHGFLSDREGMTVVAYHPDSDTGPTDQDHPMINRTIVRGLPASQLEINQAGE